MVRNGDCGCVGSENGAGSGGGPPPHRSTVPRGSGGCSLAPCHSHLWNTAEDEGDHISPTPTSHKHPAPLPACSRINGQIDANLISAGDWSVTRSQGGRPPEQQFARDAFYLWLWLATMALEINVLWMVSPGLLLFLLYCLPPSLGGGTLEERGQGYTRRHQAN